MDLAQFLSIDDLAARENGLSSSMGPDSGDSWTPRAGALAGIIMPGGVEDGQQKTGLAACAPACLGRGGAAQ
jgi:hypothetical protein